MKVENHSPAVELPQSGQTNSPSVLDAETTKSARLAEGKGTPQDWIEILWQSRKNGQSCGLSVPAQTAWCDKSPVIVIAIHNAFICSGCGKWNYGQKCHNPKCGSYGVEIFEKAIATNNRAPTNT